MQLNFHVTVNAAECRRILFLALFSKIRHIEKFICLIRQSVITYNTGMAEAINPMPCVDNEYNTNTLIRATQIFEQRCLPEFVVARVVADKCPGNTPCRWEVWYKYRNPQQLYEGGEYARRLVRRFDAVKPERTNLLEPPISITTVINDGPYYKIRYGVICECIYDDIPFFGINDDGPFDVSEISAY